jgi:hypothetical protein
MPDLRLLHVILLALLALVRGLLLDRCLHFVDPGPCTFKASQKNVQEPSHTEVWLAVPILERRDSRLETARQVGMDTYEGQTPRGKSPF